MKKSANELMQEIVYAAVIDSIAALKAASKGVPNNLLRDLNALHANTTFSDLPPELQAAITASVRSAFTRLLKEGYSVSTGDAPPPRAPRPGASPPDRRGPPSDRSRGPRGPRREGDRPKGPPRGGGDRPKGPPRGR